MLSVEEAVFIMGLRAPAEYKRLWAAVLRTNEQVGWSSSAERAVKGA